MKYTSAEAAKLLRQLNDDYNAAYLIEQESCTFVAATNEDIESVRPKYDFGESQTKLTEINEKIRKIKHAINVFNTTHTVPGFDMTIDEMLVYIPQLNQRKRALLTMRNRLPKHRTTSCGAGIIDYCYTNYDIHDAEAEYIKVSDKLAAAQLALDAINSTETMEIDI